MVLARLIRINSLYKLSEGAFIIGRKIRLVCDLKLGKKKKSNLIILIIYIHDYFSYSKEFIFKTFVFKYIMLRYFRMPNTDVECICVNPRARDEMWVGLFRNC